MDFCSCWMQSDSWAELRTSPRALRHSRIPGATSSSLSWDHREKWDGSTPSQQPHMQYAASSGGMIKAWNPCFRSNVLNLCGMNLPFSTRGWCGAGTVTLSNLIWRAEVPPLDVPLQLCQPDDSYIEGIVGPSHHRARELLLGRFSLPFLLLSRGGMELVLVVDQILPLWLGLTMHPTLG